MRLKMIGCKVLFREVSYAASQSENVIDMTFLQQGYHNTPSVLQKYLQEEIDVFESGEDRHTTYRDEMDFDGILIGYGLCSNGITGLKSSKYKMIIPRAHDCISLFLGSKNIYRDYFDSHDGGVYWYSPSWIDGAILPSKDRLEMLKADYLEKYGEDNADYLMEMEQSWIKEYKWCTFISSAVYNNDKYEQLSRDAAEFLGWGFDKVEGDNSLIKNWVDGNWNEEDFLIVEPGQIVTPSYDERVIIAQ